MATPSQSSQGSDGKRAYRSELRTQQAAETRARIVAAAAEVFGESGYAGTSLAEIGRRAGVSTESVSAHGPKRSLLMAAFEHVLTGREGDDAVSSRPDVQEIFARSDRDAVLEGMADLVLDSQARSAGIWRALCAAAADDPAVAELYDDLSRRRRADNLAALQLLAGRGMVRTDRPLDQLGDTMALLAGFDPYQLFVREFDWSHEQLRRWYIASMNDLVLAPRD